MVRVRPQFRGRGDEREQGRKARATKEKEAGKTLDFTAIGSRKCDYARVSREEEREKKRERQSRVVCKSAPLRVQGHVR